MATYERTSTDPTRNRTVPGSEAKMEAGKDKKETVKEQAAQKGHEMKEEAEEKARTKFEEGKQYGERNLESTAQALRDAAGTLKEDDQEAMARYTEWAAGQVDSVAGYFRDRSVDDVLHDVRYMARKNPGMVLGGALMAGFLAARFLKASEPMRSEIPEHRSDYFTPPAHRYGQTY
ncbi:MAG: hypothetical protein ACOC3W_01680 [Thermodesulfobacteriota bacterium]